MAVIYSYPLADEVTNDSWVLGSEMENGSRVVKNYSVGDLASFTRGFVTLNDVLDNDNVSQINAKVGRIFLYNPHLGSGLGYPYITGDKNRFNFYNNVDEYYGNLSQDTLSLANAAGDHQFNIQKPSNIETNRTVTFQDADGTVALIKYKVYTALLTQTGTNAPVATVLENTIGPITITRGGAGEYTITSSGLFTLSQTTFDITPIQGFIKQSGLSSINTIVFETRSTSNVASDGLLASKKIEIRVYN